MKFLVRRFGNRFGTYTDERGGIWFEIVSPQNEYFGFSVFNNRSNKAYDSGFHYGFVNLDRPYFIDVSSREIYSETFYPKIAYAHLFKMSVDEANTVYHDMWLNLRNYANLGEDLTDVAYARYERYISNRLKELGYDSIIFVRNIYDEVLFNSKSYDNFVQDHVFYVGNDIDWFT